ncbi:MAG: 50S ribosomal protein L29 [Pseudomonadota bacterium]|nr:50S ribosomal protein L29 [Pseudomonadota bacterium]
MKTAELRTKTDDELAGQLTSLRQEQFNLRFRGAMGQNEGTARIGTVRKTIARIKTILGERQNSATPSRKGK